MTTEANGPAPTPQDDSEFRELVFRVRFDADGIAAGSWGDALDVLQTLRDEVDDAYKHADKRWQDEEDD